MVLWSFAESYPIVRPTGWSRRAKAAPELLCSFGRACHSARHVSRSLLRPGVNVS
jgi:hypothetical protein